MTAGKKGSDEMKKIVNFFNKTEEWILIVLMAAISIVVFIQVVFRVAGNSLSWSEELARYLTIWITFIGASYGFRFGTHIGVEAFKHWLPFRVERCVDLLSNLIVAFLSVLMMKFSLDIILNVHMKFHQVSPAMRMPIWIAYLALPVGYLFMLLRNIGLSVRCVQDIIHGKPKPEETPEITGEEAD
jgi:C4-dicarboxylate transporter DctQ subunit